MRQIEQTYIDSATDGKRLSPSSREGRASVGVKLTLVFLTPREEVLVHMAAFLLDTGVVI